MRRMSGITVGALVLGLGILAGSADAQDFSLKAKWVQTPPTLDGTVEGLWDQAPELTIPVSGGRNLLGGKTEVKLKAVYTSDRIFFLAKWKDASDSVRRSPYQKQADGSWVQLKDPNDKGGDNNLNYEDKFAMLWNINIAAVEKKGWMSVIQLGGGKPYGNKFAPEAGQHADMWHWKRVRTGPVGQIDDQYLDGTRYDKEKSPEAGRKSDPKTSGGYADNKLVNGKPEWALPGNRPASPYWILDSEKVPFDDSKYKPGDEVPSIIIAPFTGDRGDISAQGVWKDGEWTLEFSRALTTQGEHDIQFNDLTKAYTFGVAVFDNAQVRHAFNPKPAKVTFEQR